MAQTRIAQGLGPASATPETELVGLAIGTRILTMDGEIPVEFLGEGDRIITRDAGARTLRAVTSVPVASATLIRVSSDSLGFGRPGEDVLLAPAQPVLLRDWRAKALFGQAQAMVPISRLVDGQYISKVESVETRVFSLQFDAQHVIYANGLELASAAVTVTA